MSSAGPTRVVLIDDDEKMVELVRSILIDDGYDVLGLTTTSGALQAVIDHDADVIVLDEVMPDRDGLDVAEEIREHRPDQAIVIFSSLFDRRLSLETHRRGYIYCEKAAGIDALEDAITEAARRAS